VHYYQFNIGDYSSHTSRLNIYEDLAYRRLLDLYYLSERPLNGCLKDVAREIGMLDTITDVEYVLNKFFVEKNNAWHNKRCDREIKAYQDKRKTAKKAGIASGIARKNKGTTVERTLNGKVTNVEPNINHKPLTINQETKIKTRASPFVVPDNIDQDVFKSFVEHRQKLKSPMTDKAKSLLITKINKLTGNPNDILNQSIENGWKGIFELKEENSNGQKITTSRAKQHQDKLREIAERDIKQNGVADFVG